VKDYKNGTALSTKKIKKIIIIKMRLDKSTKSNFKIFKIF